MPHLTADVRLAVPTLMIAGDDHTFMRSALSSIMLISSHQLVDVFARKQLLKCLRGKNERAGMLGIIGLLPVFGRSLLHSRNNFAG